MSDKAERQKRKAYLLSQIQQQRLDLSASRRDWVEATHRFDRGYALPGLRLRVGRVRRSRHPAKPPPLLNIFEED